ncbi:nuclear transport factor 2 family protein [Comamonas piscis]|uniref:Nuclear transport factor 2 family protein n=1 Tax=Comamonas piscis TaxID=1562974 RepID=A0A7G5EI63_9BURK|nr:nuclear transport factor 2 family protein [Comamonas piscis]QMV73688.1 nuclear transport factor 2 family protein [Comamonas piscis]WSO32113.1 nuclear transport factor 2 family protein [Comamonas piscis]
MNTAHNMEIVRAYFDAAARGDLEAVGAAFSDDIEWHQPGKGTLSGLHQGKAAVFALLGQFMQRSGGSFRIDAVGPLMAQGDLVSTPLHFCAEKAGAAMAMSGIDVLRIENGRIREVWLFSEDQGAEDAFWG